jgi:hypothetical protein
MERNIRASGKGRVVGVMKKPYVWVVELMNINGEYYPLNIANVNQAFSVLDMKNCIRNFPNDKYRVVKYVRASVKDQQ